MPTVYQKWSGFQAYKQGTAPHVGLTHVGEIDVKNGEQPMIVEVCDQSSRVIPGGPNLGNRRKIFWMGRPRGFLRGHASSRDQDL